MGGRVTCCTHAPIAAHQWLHPSLLNMESYALKTKQKNVTELQTDLCSPTVGLRPPLSAASGWRGGDDAPYWAPPPSGLPLSFYLGFFGYQTTGSASRLQVCLVPPNSLPLCPPPKPPPLRRLFGVTGNCAACSKLIPAFEMVMRARDNVYHLDCFACQLCRQR